MIAAQVLNGFVLFFWLAVAHALADYPLQGDFMSQAKNRNTPLGALFWRWVLPAHALIHGGFVALVTGSVVLGVLETVAHAVIDFCKCEGWISLNDDQALHLLCKVVWIVLVLSGLLGQVVTPFCVFPLPIIGKT